MNMHVERNTLLIVFEYRDGEPEADHGEINRHALCRKRNHRPSLAGVLKTNSRHSRAGKPPRRFQSRNGIVRKGCKVLRICPAG